MSLFINIFHLIEKIIKQRKIIRAISKKKIVLLETDFL